MPDHFAEGLDPEVGAAVREAINVYAEHGAEIVELEDEERLEFLQELGMEEPGLNRVIRAGYQLLNLHTYFTAGVKEVRAWPGRSGATAPEAAGVIHTDFQKGFIRAEVISYEDFIAHNGEQGAKDAGRWRLEEFNELQTRHGFLEEQLEDVRTTRRELSRVIAAVDAEIQNVFAAAFADVSQNFTELFGLLFPGGSGKLTLTHPDDLLNTGIEVEAKPSGKNVKKLSLLSGGERSLTALAYLFAVFRSRPSPFYVMDEVEAALDDVNLHRFLGLIQEFRKDAQLIIVSHQKRTMEAGDCLLGVSMQPGGSSKVVTERASTASSASGSA